MRVVKHLKGSVEAGPKSALRQSGQSEWHPGDCTCRKCRRKAALERRSKPRYGQGEQ